MGETILASISSLLFGVAIFTCGGWIKTLSDYKTLREAFDKQGKLLDESTLNQRITAEVMKAVRDLSEQRAGGN